MKPLSELVDAWRSESLELLPSKSEESITIDLCADQLEAWLGEAENALRESLLSSASIFWIRKKIFGTLGTTQEGK